MSIINFLICIYVRMATSAIFMSAQVVLYVTKSICIISVLCANEPICSLYSSYYFFAWVLRLFLNLSIHIASRISSGYLTSSRLCTAGWASQEVLQRWKNFWFGRWDLIHESLGASCTKRFLHYELCKARNILHRKYFMLQFIKLLVI